MTSASELFYTRRSRFGRNLDPFDVGSPSPVDRGSRRHRRDRIDPDGCDPPRRVPHYHRRPPHHRPPVSPQDRELIRPDHGGHQFASGNATRSGSQNNMRDRVQFSGSDRLPGAVLLARERLLDRLRGVALPGSRQRNQISPSSQQNETVVGDELWFTDAGDWETDTYRDWLPTITSVANSIDRQTSNKPPGLTQDALNCLPTEVFGILVEGAKEYASREITECSICLESFLEGEELVCLPCLHRFHVSCLVPWIRTCGDCPYCRTGILVKTDQIEHV